MRAVRVHEFGKDPRVDEIAPPGPPGRDEILIDVTAAGVGAWDLGVRDGGLARFLPDALPFTMGAQLAGRVREAGPGVSGFAAGDRVIANPGIVGAWAETVRVRASACGRAPATTDDGEAATLPVRALTAWQGLELLDLPRGATLFVCGGGGAVGRAAIELAVGRGLRVLTIAGEDELEALRRLGAEEAADHRGDWSGRIRAAGPGGVDALLDLVGGDSLDRALDLTRDGARAVTTIAHAARAASPRAPAVEFLAMRSSTEDLETIADLVDRGGLTPQVARRYPLDQAAAALDAAASRTPTDGDIALEV